jgi:diguanylate cyclase (GGDEF)-like protein
VNFKERFKPFIEHRRQLKTIYVATCDETGQPNCAPRLLIDITEPNHIFYVDFKSSQSYANICSTKKVSLAFMDERNLVSFKINGRCETIQSSKELKTVKDKWAKIVNGYHAERIIERVTGVVSGRVGEIVLSEDYVFIKFSAEKMKHAVIRHPSAYPIGKIAALQLRIDDLQKVVEKQKEDGREMEVSRDSYKASSDMFEVAAMQDNLTGLYNQRGFIVLVEQQLKIAKRQKKDSFFIFSDVDHLKRINDTFGHAKGDQTLVEIARILKKSFRESDIIARIGGDEFAVAMVDCGKENLDLAKGRLKKNIEAYNRNSREAYPIELSVGVACCNSDDTIDLRKLLHQSDQMMYEEKRKNNPESL